MKGYFLRLFWFWCLVPEYDHGQPGELYPNLDYTAPEYCSLESVGPAADMFSFGMLVFCVHNRRPLLQSNRSVDSISSEIRH